MYQLRIFSNLLLLMATTVFFACDKSDTPAYVYTDDLDERGVWGCGIPCGNVVTQDEGCTLELGVCEAAESMPDVSTDEQIGSGMRISSLNGGRTLRYEILTPKFLYLINGSNDGNEDKDKDYVRLYQSVEDRLDSLDMPYAKAITDYIVTHFRVPKDLKYSAAATQLILKTFGLNGETITVREAEYDIIRDKKHPYGYFDLNVAVQ